MSGIYQKHVNQSTVTNPSSGSTFVGVNESGELFTKSESGTVSVVSQRYEVSNQTIVFPFLDVDNIFIELLSGPSYSMFIGDLVTATVSGICDGRYISEIVPADFLAPGVYSSSVAFNGLTKISSDLDPTQRTSSNNYNYQTINTPEGLAFDVNYQNNSYAFLVSYAFSASASGETMSHLSHAIQVIDGGDLFNGLIRISLDIDNETASYIEGTGTFSFTTPQYQNVEI